MTPSKEYKRIKFEVKEDIAYLEFGAFDDKAMTTLDEESLLELDSIADELTQGQKTLKGLIAHSHKKRCFLAGADVNLINSLKTESQGADGSERGQNIFNKFEDLKIPKVVCVHGVCLGGGLELSLAFDSILASDDNSTVLGLPEVKLGIIPGFGGTYRLPKRIGLPKALDMILTGRAIKAKKAKRMGLVDGVYPKERLLDFAAMHFKRESQKSWRDSLESFASDNFLSRKVIFQKARENVLKKTKGFYQAPLKILDVMEAGMMKGRSSYLSSEAQAFGELCISEQSKNLQQIFFMTEKVKKYSGPKGAGNVPILKRGATLGAGTMGGGIAWLMADHDMHPHMKDLNREALELGLKQSSQNFHSMLKKRKITWDDLERKQRSIHCQTDYSGFKSMDLVIEAIVENMDIKKSVFSELEKEVNPNCLITSNTSSLSVEEMAKSMESNHRFAGLHFFNPVHRMPLVEIITHSQCSPETTQALYEWVIRVKKTPVIVKDGPGFLVNRILMPYLNEASFLLEEGVAIEDIDQACLNFGMPMGPCRLLDEVGIDVAEKVAKILHDGLGDRAMSSSLSSKLSEKGMLGRKNKKGFYLYEEDEFNPSINPEVESLLPQQSKTMNEVDIQMRVFLPMINEAAIILDEKIVESPADVDLGLIFGIGFPPFRGGLLRYADSEGLDRILDAIKRFSETVSDKRYAPSAFLKELVSSKKKFYDL